jgi:hypothetical protein
MHMQFALCTFISSSFHFSKCLTTAKIMTAITRVPIPSFFKGLVLFCGPNLYKKFFTAYKSLFFGTLHFFRPEGRWELWPAELFIRVHLHICILNLPLEFIIERRIILTSTN